MKWIRNFSVALLLQFLINPLHSAADNNYPVARIINGTAISSRTSPVVQVRQKTTKGTFLCSGSLIAPDAVLTARHCVTTRRRLMRVVAERKSYSVRLVRRHPRFFLDRTGIAFNDVAVLRLTHATKISPLPLLVSHPMAAGDPVSIFGYGLNEFGRIGILRQGETDLVDVSEDFLVTQLSSSSGSDPCNGDSGGPAEFSYVDANGVSRSGIVGVTSTGTAVNCGLGDLTRYINLQTPSVMNFILGQVPSAVLQ